MHKKKLLEEHEKPMKAQHKGTKHKLTHSEEVKGGNDSHEHNHAHHAKMAKHHLSALHKIAKSGIKHQKAK